MFGQQYQLKELFDKYGWEFLELWIPKGRWIAEIWIIKSNWSPTDCFITMNFVVDPQWEDKNKKHLGVWAVALALTESHYTADGLQIASDSKYETHDKNFVTVHIRPNWEKKFPEIFEELSNLRQKFDNLKR